MDGSEGRTQGVDPRGGSKGRIRGVDPKAGSEGWIRILCHVWVGGMAPRCGAGKAGGAAHTGGRVGGCRIARQPWRP
eukprot:5890-Chlamydomonas_euryale.AAC.1